MTGGADADYGPGMERDAAVRLVIELVGVVELARRLGIRPASVSTWHRIPAERVAAVSEATGVPRHVLRPDICEPPAPMSRRRERDRRRMAAPV